MICMPMLLEMVFKDGKFYSIVAILFILTVNAVKINVFFPSHQAYYLCFRLGLKPKLFASSQPRDW